MEINASRSLKVAYAMSILWAVVPVGLASSGWVALAMGGGGMGIPYIGPIFFLGLGVYRAIAVFRNPCALGSYDVKGFAVLLRKFGIFSLYFGAILGTVNLFSRPIMAALITTRSQSGAEFLIAGMALAFLGGFGSLGIVAFELSRIIGMEEGLREK